MKTALVLLCLLLAAPAYAAGDTAHGEQIYKSKCGMCHAPDHNRVGPQSAGVFGRKAGIVPDYSYSSALKDSGLVWDAATLDKWLSGPSNLVPGTKMSFHLENAQDRSDVIAYLKTLPAPAR